MQLFAERAWGATHPVENRWLTFEGDVPFLANKTLGNVMYVREAYELLEAKLDSLKAEGLSHVVIIGNPGLGKSYFALYMLLRQGFLFCAHTMELMLITCVSK